MHMHEVLRKVLELVVISGVLRGSYISGNKGVVSGVGRNNPNGRRIFEGRYARGILWKEKMMKLKNEE